MTPHHKGQAEKIICLYCKKELKGKESEKHRCIFELIDLLAHEIAKIKEDHCGNAGKNWIDYFYTVEEEVVKNYTPKKT